MPATAKIAPRIRPEEVSSRLGGRGRILFVDARSAQAWAQSECRLPGALRISVEQMELLQRIPRGHPIVVYCSWLNESSCDVVAVQLLELGFTDVYSLEGGFDAWLKAGLPSEHKDAGLAVDMAPEAPSMPD